VQQNSDKVSLVDTGRVAGSGSESGVGLRMGMGMGISDRYSEDL
jgi:hypothetical protein